MLDPFMGSGQTAIAALKTDRHYVGYEIDEKYVALCAISDHQGDEPKDQTSQFSREMPGFPLSRHPPGKLPYPIRDIDPAKVSILLISEAAPEKPADDYYAGRRRPLRPNDCPGIPGCRGKV